MPHVTFKNFLDDTSSSLFVGEAGIWILHPFSNFQFNLFADNCDEAKSDRFPKDYGS